MNHAAILDAWRAKLGLRAAADPFRDPIAQAFHDALPVLLDCVLGHEAMKAAEEHLERLMRIRAVQDFTPGEAAAFLFDLKPLLRSLEDHARVDSLALAAFVHFMLSREALQRARLHELRRATAVMERIPV